MMNEMNIQLNAYIETHKEAAFSFLSELVKEKSVQGNEKKAQQLVISKLEGLGLRVDVWEPDIKTLKGHPNFVSTKAEFIGSPNVVGTLKGTGGGKSIILNGHIDVVPAGDLAKWTDDPYSGIIRDGKMYGRGTTDMKGGTLSLLLALEAIIRSGIKLKGDVILQSVIEEESGGAGSLATILKGYHADAAIIPEPTKLKLFVKQQGSMWFRVTVRGVVAHGGTRYEGVSAIELAWEVHSAILDLEKKRNLEISDPLYKGVPIPIPINVGKIEGGTWPSSVPDVVTIEGRMGVGPGEEMENAKKELRKCLLDLGESNNWLKRNPVELAFFGAQWVPNAVEQNHPLVQLIEEKYQELFDEKIRVEASPWGTDAGLYGALANIPAVVIGPGETKVAHYPDEYIELKEVVRAAKLFAALMIDWCEVA
jgi:acetylornithine deacetylase